MITTVRRQRAIVAVLCLCGLAAATMQALVIPLAPELPRLLNASPEDASWLITSTQLSAAVATPCLARLADMYGKRLFIVVSLVSMLVGSLLGMVAQSLVVFVIARALQGASLALLPIGMSIMRDELPRERLRGGVAFLSATLAAGSALALVAAGPIYQAFGLHALFAIAGLQAAVLIVAVWIIVPESPMRSRGRFDVVGAILMSIALASGLIGITKGGHWGWTSPSTLLAFLTCALTTVVWLAWEQRVRDPLVDLRSTSSRPVLLTDIVAVLAGFALYCNLLTLAGVLQAPTSTGYGHGLSTFQAGLAMMPTAAAMFLIAPVSARLSGRFGARTTLIAGCWVLALGYVLRIALTATIWQVSLGAVIVSCGTMLAYSSMPLIIMASVPSSETAAANGINNVARYIGFATASAAMAAVLSTMTIGDGASTLPSHTAYIVIHAIAAAAAIAGAVIAIAIPIRRVLMSRDMSVVNAEGV